MTELKSDFDLAAFLARSGPGRTIVLAKPQSFFFSQGSPGDCIFFLQNGRARLTVSSAAGKEATIMLISPGDFFGEESLATQSSPRMASARAITRCTALKIDRQEMIRVMQEDRAFSARFLTFLLSRNMRIQADLVDQLFNSTEKRLARTLLLMADFDKPGKPELLIPQITQETLAELIGTTRSQVNFFMTRFRERGFIEYKRRILVHKSLLNVLLQD